MSSHNRRPDPPNDALRFARNLLLSASFALALFMPHSAVALFVDVPETLNGFDCALPDCWSEQGDAGDRTDPQRTEPDGGGPSQTKLFYGDVGGFDDPSDAFTFELVNGNANGNGSVFDIAIGFNDFFAVELWDGDLDVPPNEAYPPDDAFPPGLFNMAYRFNGLPPGAYIVQVSAPFDPPFTIGVGIIGLPPPGGGVNFGPAQVPEPATIALLGLGLAGLGFARRRRNST